VSVAVEVEVTVSARLAVRVREPPTPVTVTLNGPVLAFAAAVKASVDVPEPGATIDDGVKVAVTPLGTPDTDRATELLNDPNTYDVTPTEALFPCCTLTEVGATEIARSGAVVVPMT